MDDEYNVKLRVDTSELTLAAQQAQLMAYSAAASAGQNGLSPITSIANSTFSQAQAAQYGASGISPMMSAMASPFSSSMAMMSPFQHMGQGNYTTPQGFLAGTPVGPQSYAAAAPNIAGTLGNMGLRSFANSALGGAADRYFPGLGISSMGFYGGGGRLDLPVFRAQQMASERFAESMDRLGVGISKGLVGGAIAGAGLASIMAPGIIGTPIGMAGFALGQSADYMYNVQEKYLELGNYYRDAMGTTMRDKLGGGATHHQAAEFMRGMGKQVGGDKYLLRDDYNLLVQTGTELGFMQTTQTPQASLNAIDNLAKSVKTMAALGTKLVDMQKDMELLRSVGVDLSRNQTDVARYMGTMGFNAFSANMTTGQMLQASTAASPLFSSMGLAPTVGSTIHSQSLAMAGEGIRMGAFSIADQAYYGGKEGMAEAQSRAIAALNRTGLGQVGILGSMADPLLSQQLMSGRGGMSEILNSKALGMDVNQYANLMYRMPQFSTEMNSNQFGMGQVATFVNSIKESLGGKVSLGELSQILSRRGMSPDDARLLVRQIEEAPSTLRGMQQSNLNYAAQKVMETYRPPANIFNNPSVFFQKTLESWFDPMLANMAASREDFMGHMEHWVQGSLLGPYMDPNHMRTMKLDKSLVGLAGVDTALALYNRSDKDRAEAAGFLDKETERLTRRNIRQQLVEGETPLDRGFFEQATYGGMYKEGSALRSIRDQRKARYANELRLLGSEQGDLAAQNLSSLGLETSIKNEEELDKMLTRMEYAGLTEKEQTNVRGFVNTKGLSANLRKRFRNLIQIGQVNPIEEEGLVQDVMKNRTLYSSIADGLGAGGNGSISEEGQKAVNQMLAAPVSSLQDQAARIQAAQQNGASNEEIVVLMSQLALGDNRLTSKAVQDLATYSPERMRQVGKYWEGVGKRTKGAERDSVVNTLSVIGDLSTLHGRDDALKGIEKEYDKVKEPANQLLRRLGISGEASGQEIALISAAVGERVLSAEKATKNIYGGEGAAVDQNQFGWGIIGMIPGLGKYVGSGSTTDLSQRLQVLSPEERKQYFAIADPQEQETFIAQKAQNRSGLVQQLLGASPTSRQLGLVNAIGSADIRDLSKYGLGNPKNVDKAVRMYASEATDLKNMNTRELRAFFQIAGNKDMASINEALSSGVVSSGELAALLKKAKNAKTDGTEEIKGVKDLSGLILDITQGGLDEGTAAERLAGVLEGGFGWDPRAGDNAKADSASAMAKVFGQGANKNIAAVTGSLIAMTQTKEQFTDRLMIDPKGKGGYLNKEQMTGIQQASAAIAQQAEVVRMISESVEKVPKSLEEFRKDFKREVGESQTNKDLVAVLNKLNNTLSKPEKISTGTMTYKPGEKRP